MVVDDDDKHDDDDDDDTHDDDDDDDDDGSNDDGCLISCAYDTVPENPMAFHDPPFSSVIPVVIPLISNRDYYLSAVECMRQDEPKVTFPELGADRIAFTASCVRHWIEKFLYPTYGSKWPYRVSECRIG